MRELPSLAELALELRGWFMALPEPVRQVVLANARTLTLENGERLYARGDKATGIFFVAKGCMLVSGVSREGREIILDFYGAGGLFGEVSALDGLPRSHSAEAHGAAELRYVPHARLEKLLLEQPAFSRALLRVEALRLRMLLTALESYSTQSLEQRLANRLLMLAVQYGVPGAQGTRIELHLSQETMARLVGSTRQRVNQIFNAWKAASLVEQKYGRVTLLDPAALRSLPGA